MRIEEFVFLFITVFMSGAFFGSVLTRAIIKMNEDRKVLKDETQKSDFEWDVGLYSDEWLNRNKDIDDE